MATARMTGLDESQEDAMRLEIPMTVIPTKVRISLFWNVERVARDSGFRQGDGFQTKFSAARFGPERRCS